MLFISVEDFFEKTKEMTKLTREEERLCAIRKAQGDMDAREKLLQSYLPVVAAVIRRAPKEIQTLKTVYRCVASLEEGVDRFDFLQDGETFLHHLSWRMRQCITKCIVDRP